MGTKGYISVKSSAAENIVFTRIVGMTSDGTPDNLVRVSKSLNKAVISTEDGVATVDWSVAEQVLKELDPKQEWLFFSQLGEPSYLSYTSVLNPFNATVEVENRKTGALTVYPLA